MIRQTLIAIVSFVAGILVAASVATFANPELKVEYGQCRFGKAHDGTFYDSTMSPHLHLTPRCAEIAVASRFAGSSWGWRVGFIASGAVESRDSMAPMNDGYYSPNPCSDAQWENCHSLFGGTGRMHGIALSFTRDWRLSGRWWTQGEAGLLFFEHYFNGYAKPQDFRNSTVIATGAQTGTPDKWEGGSLNQSSKFPGMPIPRIGASVGFGPVYLALRYHFAPGTLGLMGHDGSSATDHSFLQAVVGLSIPLP